MGNTTRVGSIRRKSGLLHKFRTSFGQPEERGEKVKKIRFNEGPMNQTCRQNEGPRVTGLRKRRPGSRRPKSEPMSGSIFKNRKSAVGAGEGE